MKQKVSAFVLVLSLAVALSGCGPTQPQKYASLNDLVAAYESAGFPCDWELDEDSSGIEAWGYCHDGNYLSWWLDEPGVEEKVAERAEMSIETMESYDEPYALLVGPNWLIREEKSKELQKAIGGKLITG